MRKDTIHKGSSIKRLVWELIFIFSTVLIFRSLWLIMDDYFGPTGLGIWMVLGIAIAIISLRELNKFHKR